MFEIASLKYMQENPVKGVLLYILVSPIAVVVGLLLLPIALVWSIYLTIKY